MRRLKKTVSVAVALLLILSAVFCFTACSGEQSITFFALDTVIGIRILEGGSQQLLNALQAEIMRLDKIFDRFDGELYRINSQGGGEASVELCSALEAALALCEQTEGAFDITVGAVSSLWDFKAGRLPTSEQLLEAVKKVDYKRVKVEDGIISLNGAQIDLGGFAKGYICDLAAEYLKNNRVTEAILDLGGNIYVIGDKGGRGYNIGIADPNGGDPVHSVNISSCAAVTSGIYQRNFELDGKKYHHILDPESGMPVQNELASVTVICQSAARADALSTAMMVLGKEDASRLAKLLDVTAIFIGKDGSVTSTKDGI